MLNKNQEWTKAIQTKKKIQKKEHFCNNRWIARNCFKRVKKMFSAADDGWKWNGVSVTFK